MNIAIIDDDQEILNILNKFLSKSGNSITTYTNPLSALSSLKANIDVVLLDVVMPQMNGLDLLPKLREKYPNMKIIIMTATSTLDRVLEAHRKDATFYIMKPFESLAKLEAKIVEIHQQ